MKKFGFRLVIVLVFILGGTYWGFKLYAEKTTKEQIDNNIAAIAPYATVKYKAVHVDPLTMDVTISNLTIAPVDSEQKIKINAIIVCDIDLESEIPTFLDIVFEGLEMPIENFGKNAKVLEELGYKDKIIFNLALAYHYAQEKQTINIKKIKIGADQIGDLELSLQLSNLDLKSDKLVSLLFSYQQIMLHSATINYHDDSLMEKIFQATAKKEKSTPEQIKKQAIQAIDQAISTEIEQFTRHALQQIKNFINTPEQLSLSIAPIKPLPLSRLREIKEPKEIIGLLNVTIES